LFRKNSYFFYSNFNSDCIKVKLIKNWKRFVATVCESFQSSNQTWRMEDNLLWTSFFILLLSYMYQKLYVCKNTQPKYKQYFEFKFLPNPYAHSGSVSLMVFMFTFSIFFKKKQVAILKILQYLNWSNWWSCGCLSKDASC
jgi:hypothetical protein